MHNGVADCPHQPLASSKTTSPPRQRDEHSDTDLEVENILFGRQTGAWESYYRDWRSYMFRPIPTPREGVVPQVLEPRFYSEDDVMKVYVQYEPLTSESRPFTYLLWRQLSEADLMAFLQFHEATPAAVHDALKQYRRKVRQASSNTQLLGTATSPKVARGPKEPTNSRYRWVAPGPLILDKIGEASKLAVRCAASRGLAVKDTDRLPCLPSISQTGPQGGKLAVRQCCSKKCF